MKVKYDIYFKRKGVIRCSSFVKDKQHKKTSREEANLVGGIFCESSFICKCTFQVHLF